jgi:hypothetical protein
MKFLIRGSFLFLFVLLINSSIADDSNYELESVEDDDTLDYSGEIFYLTFFFLLQFAHLFSSFFDVNANGLQT